MWALPGLLAAVQRFAEGLGRGAEDKNASRCTEIMDRVMADVNPFSVYDIYADACPADGSAAGRARRAGAVAGQLSRALGGVGGGDPPCQPPLHAPASLTGLVISMSCVLQSQDSRTSKLMQSQSEPGAAPFGACCATPLRPTVGTEAVWFACRPRPTSQAVCVHDAKPVETV